ncbi:small ribosomal subunit protein uS7m [Culicoides brevitarsis]|uniref:small ribosomal subunit protein uS7m n=1 Tax=Culicoides brevitarsis TaxID=469753 RepID=UPI00307B501D
MFCIQKFLQVTAKSQIIIPRCMSQYPSTFQKPVFKHEKQKEAEETGELARLSHLPVRAAVNDATNSVFHNEYVRQFTNYVMEDGRKALARKLIEEGFENIKRIQLERYHLASEEEKKNIETEPLKIFLKAIENARPLLTLTAIKRGGSTYQVPIPITEKKSIFMSMKWILEASNEKERKVLFPDKFAWEVLDAANNQGRVIKKKLDLHKQCEANRAYAHYRWG